MPDQVTAVVRTMAQALAGLIITWLAALPLVSEVGLSLDQDVVEGAIFTIVTGGWMLLIRWLETSVNPVFGYLNVVKKTPTYTTE